MNQHLWWFLARASGLTAWWASSVAVIFGLLLSARVVIRRGAPAWLLALHRFVAMLSVLLVAVHIAALVADSYLHFGPREVLIPFATRWRPVPVAAGVVAFYLLAAVEATSLVMRRLPRRVWRLVHRSSYAVFGLSSLHALTAGTDRSNLVVQWSALLIGAAFTFLVLFRQLTAGQPRSRPVSAGPRSEESHGNTHPDHRRQQPLPRSRERRVPSDAGV